MAINALHRNRTPGNCTPARSRAGQCCAIFLLGFACCLTSVGGAASGLAQAAPESAAALIHRVMPGRSTSFVCEAIPAENGKDVFEIDTRDGRILLRGNNAVSQAMAFNWYLRYVARLDYGWEATGPLRAEGRLPLPASRIHQVCAARERFFLNYCTYGYSLPWWDWAQWERFLDWMAMNGINRPLLQAGQEATWLRVWTSLGLREDQVRQFFSGPGHLPWHRMANLDKWGGPLPRSYINGQAQLQARILERARSLGMKPILPSFAGHVPEALKSVKPDAHITQIAPGWGGMAPEYSTWFLDPTDPLFTEVQARFIREERAMYGTDHLYSADPFNEIAPPSWEPDYLASVAKTIYASIAAADPEAIWYQMSWNFFYDEKWTAPRLKALTLAVPQGKLVYLDYVCEQAEFFRKTENFHGAPFIWCYVGNFGGNTHFTAPLNRVTSRLTAAVPVQNCLGIGSTLEGLNINPIGYDLVFEQPWHPGAAVDLDAWVKDYATRRAGRPDPAVIGAWNLVARNLLVDDPEGLWGRAILLQTIPHYEPGQTPALSFPLKQKFLVEALDQMLAASAASRKADGYQFDLVNLTRQALGNALPGIHQRMMRAVAQQDLRSFRRESARFLELGRDLDTLLGTREEFLLGRWIADARAWGKTEAEKDYYERNAREIITTWHAPGGGLSDYARRQWNGLVRSYYLPHWEEFVRRLETSLPEHKAFDGAAYGQWRVQFDGKWVSSRNEKFAQAPTGDACRLARQLVAKYRTDLLPAPSQVRLTRPEWSPAIVAGGPQRWEWDAAALVQGAGAYSVKFQYTSGASALAITRVALIQNGREIATDTHEGWTGHQNRQNTYELKVPQLDTGKPVRLVMEVEPASSTDTAGRIEIQGPIVK